MDNIELLDKEESVEFDSNGEKALQQHLFKKKVSKDLVKRNKKQFIFAEIIPIVLLVFVFLFTFNFYKVLGTGMDSNVTWQNNFIIINKLSYFINNPDYGDVIIYKNDKTSISRIIGCPGDTISFDNGVIFVNGNVISEDYATGHFIGNDSFVLSDDSYFVMPDNRKSVIRLFSQKDIIKEKDIIGKVVGKL